MAFSRYSVVAAVAGTLSLAMLTGCPGPTQTTTSPSPSASGAASSAPSTTPSGAASTTPSTTPSGAASTAPTPVPSNPNNGTRTFSGSVTDETGAAVDPAANVTVTVTSQNPSVPFTTTVPVTQGHYVVPNAPADVVLSVTASGTGYSSRTQVTSVASSSTSTAQTLNFGKDLNNSSDTTGNGYFLSKFPEISSVVPADQATNVDPTKINVVLTVSKPLDSDNRNRLVSALRLAPANDAADPTDTGKAKDVSTNSTSQTPSTFAAVDNGGGSAGGGAALVTNGTVPTAFVLANFLGDYQVNAGSAFVTNDNIASATWDSTGTQVTLSFNAPLITNTNGVANYQVLLLSQGQNIQDANGNILGSSNLANVGTAYANGGTGGWLILNAFRNKSLALDTNATTAALRWAETHKNNSNFSVAQDTTAPQVTGVTVQSPTTNARLLVTFNKPMVAFGKNQSYVASTVLNAYDGGALNVANYQFRVGKQASDLADTWDSPTSTTLNNWGGTGTTSQGTAMTYLFAQASGSNGFIADVVTTDPKTVRIYQPTTNTTTPILPTDAHAIKVKITAGVKDVAGNSVSTANSSNYQVGTF